MKRIILGLSALISIVSLNSCKSEGGTETTSTSDSLNTDTTLQTPEILEMTNGGLTLTEVVGSPDFPDAKLILKKPLLDANLAVGTVDFEFGVESDTYKLGVVSTDAASKGCANSDKGQHIHIILDNQPYEASYDSNYTTKASLDAGNHVVLAFLSRSYHESIKSKDAYQLSQFKVGDEGMDAVDLAAEHLFYSRPKGEYKAKDVEQVMLDFYLVNTTISEEGNYVLATFNDSTEFKITKWVPFFVKGLPLGLNKVELKLMNKENEVIPGPFNAVVREFSLVN